jgi:hypothetical protein
MIRCSRTFVAMNAGCLQRKFDRAPGQLAAIKSNVKPPNRLRSACTFISLFNRPLGHENGSLLFSAAAAPTFRRKARPHAEYPCNKCLP